MLGIFGLMERLSANHIDMRVFFFLWFQTKTTAYTVAVRTIVSYRILLHAKQHIYANNGNNDMGTLLL